MTGHGLVLDPLEARVARRHHRSGAPLCPFCGGAGRHWCMDGETPQRPEAYGYRRELRDPLTSEFRRRTLRRSVAVGVLLRRARRAEANGLHVVAERIYARVHERLKLAIAPDEDE